MLSEGRVIKRARRRFTAHARDLAVRRYPPTGLAWRVCALCARPHAAAGDACQTLTTELTRILRGDKIWESSRSGASGPRRASLAPILATYHAALVEAGFTRDEALTLTAGIQTSMLTIVAAQWAMGRPAPPFETGE